MRKDSYDRPDGDHDAERVRTTDDLFGDDAGDEPTPEDVKLDRAYEEAGAVLSGRPTLPEGMASTQRRRFLKAMGATAAVGAAAGCLGMFSQEPEAAGTDDDDFDYDEIESFKLDWVPKQLIKNINVQAAHNDETLFFRFNWEQPDAGGWYHDYIVYNGDEGQWEHYLSPDPWVADSDHEDHRGFYEDRVTMLIGDDTVRGFENFLGWLTVHMGTRSLPGEATAEEVEAHPHLGDDGLGRNDVRKFIPQSREGEWWEAPWDDVRPQEELDEMLERGEFIELPMFRAHRANPMRYGTDHHVLDYRHGDEGTNTFGTMDWDEDDGPEFMFDPEIVEDGAITIDQLNDREIPQDLFYDEREEWLDEEDPYYIHEDWLVPFDPDVAEFDGAAIPRRPLQEPEGSAADWRTMGLWEDGEWTVEMDRDLDTGHVDNVLLEPGRTYNWGPAIHHGFNARWHWVAYPYKLGIGEGTDADVRAERFDGDEPDWDDVETYTIPLIYPGQVDWTWLTSPQHRGYIPTRNDEMSIWEVHENPRAMAALLLGMEVGEDPRR